jgi:glycosyltransferase involved in cell wall biosynthesis
VCFFVDPDNPDDFANKLIKYKDDKTLMNEWSANSRRLSIEVFDKSILSAKVADVIEMSYNKLI